MAETKAVTNTMRHEEYNRRYSALVDITEAISNQEREEPEAGSDEARNLAQEAYDLMLEVPPASGRYKYLRSVFNYHGGYGAVKVHPADNSKEAKKIALREPKMPASHHASRGRTIKATPRQLADGKVAALESTLSACHHTVAELTVQLEEAKRTLKETESKLEAARKAAKGHRGGARKAQSATPQAEPKATPTPKGELSEAMKTTLKVIGSGKAVKTSLTAKQFSAARMHLAMRKLITKKADGVYVLTAEGRKLITKGL